MRINEILCEAYPLEHVYNAVEGNETFQNNPDYSELEDAWVGGVANFGDPEAATVIQSIPDYYDYHDALVQAVRQHLGDPFQAWRMIAPEQLELWKAGGDIGQMAVSVNKQSALGFQKFAPNQGKQLQLIELQVPAEAVVMRGHPSEYELVVDGNEISFDTIKMV